MQAIQLHNGDGYTVTSVPDDRSWEFSTPSGELLTVRSGELIYKVVDLLIERDEAQAGGGVVAELLERCITAILQDRAIHPDLPRRPELIAELKAALARGGAP